MNIVVVGGGTAGWLTALYAQKVYPHETIILVESEEIGILGAGEGVTPHLAHLFEFLELPVFDLITNAKATIKNGIKFTNWSDSLKHYIHPFTPPNKTSEVHALTSNPYLPYETFVAPMYGAHVGHTFDQYSFGEKISKEKKVPFIRSQSTTQNSSDIFYEVISGWAVHFDANLVAKFLRKVGEQRGIVRVEGIVSHIEADPDGYITSLRLETDKVIDVDFVFDCTGFKRLIIGNFYQATWKSHADHLPAKKAIPFFLPPDKEIPPYTEAIAMDYGWMWKIPLQHRYGCGYVFDSNFISDEDAKKELDNYFGFEVESPRTFTFNAGCFKEIWIKNCLALGLASGFIEPLEATSIMQTCNTLKRFFSLPLNVTCKDDVDRALLNNQYLKETQEIVNFLYLHYVTDKQNTDFWKNFITNNEAPEQIDYLLNVVKRRPPVFADLKTYDHAFPISSFLYVLIGNGIVTGKDLQHYWTLLQHPQLDQYVNLVNTQNQFLALAESHAAFLKVFTG